MSLPRRWGPLVVDSYQLQFACDAMFGGLARWWRAAGYDTTWKPISRTGSREQGFGYH
jgi:uncharacterized protein with PIN domain